MGIYGGIGTVDEAYGEYAHANWPQPRACQDEGGGQSETIA